MTSRYLTSSIAVIAVLISCQSNIQSNQNWPDDYASSHTDTMVFEDHDLALCINNFELFDTCYPFVFSSCTYQKSGYRLINSAYEDVIPGMSNWYKIESDSLLHMTVFFSQTPDYYENSATYLEHLKYKERAIRQATKTTRTPEFEACFKKKNMTLGFQAYSDSINNKINEELKAIVITDQTELEIYLHHATPSGAENLPAFYKVIQSLELIKLK